MSFGAPLAFALSIVALPIVVCWMAGSIALRRTG